MSQTLIYSVMSEHSLAQKFGDISFGMKRDEVRKVMGARLVKAF